MASVSETVSFTAVGRDVQAEADSAGTEVGQAVKAFAQWVGVDQEFLDASWAVSVSKGDGSAYLSFSRVAKAAYVAPEFPSAIEPAPEAVASQVRAAEGWVDQEADVQPEEPAVPAEAPAAPAEPAPAEEGNAVADAPAVPVDPEAAA